MLIIFFCRTWASASSTKMRGHQSIVLGSGTRRKPESCLDFNLVLCWKVLERLLLVFIFCNSAIDCYAGWGLLVNQSFSILYIMNWLTQSLLAVNNFVSTCRYCRLVHPYPPSIGICNQSANFCDLELLISMFGFEFFFCFWHNCHFSLSTITRGSILSLNFKTVV